MYPQQINQNIHFDVEEDEEKRNQCEQSIVKSKQIKMDPLALCDLSTK